MNPNRLEKIKEVVKKRQNNFTVILEDVHDLHNLGAVMRSADSVGIQEVFVLYKETNPKKIKLGKRTSAGARKWLDVHFYTDAKACFEHVRRKYDKIYCTHLAEDAKEVYDLDLTESVALLFGNEHKGVSESSLAEADGNFIIPQVGMVQSLNISVACAISLYEGYRQRKAKGFYDTNSPQSETQQTALLNHYFEKHKIGDSPLIAHRKNN